MIAKISQNWWLFLVRGLVAILFGALAFVSPSQAWLALVMLLGAYVLLDGLVTLVAGIEFNRFFDRAWVIILEGVTGLIAGLLTLIWPQPASQVVYFMIVAWAVMTGVFEIVAAMRIRFFIVGEWTMILAGVLSILFGILLFAFPTAGVMGMVWVIAFYAIVFGITQIVLSSRLHGLQSLVKDSGLSGL